MITFATPVGCKLESSAGGVEARCDAALTATPAQRDVDDPVLAGWKVDGSQSILFLTGSGFRRVESFELRNPSRLVIDFMGKRPRGGKPSAPAAAAIVSAPRPIVVLDPGHGGVETGAVGPGGLQEKEVVLDLARRLKVALEREGYTAILTRDGDNVLPLDDRTAVANYNRAVLFVSIHLNASSRASAVGAETYFLSSESTDDEARTLAALENKAYAAGDANSPSPPPSVGKDIELILWDLAQQRYLEESARLAESVQRELNTLTGVRDRGVRQAPFTVLMGATMPAILVEVGFISNPEEESRLRDDGYRDRIVEGIARAVREFGGGRAAAGGSKP